MFMQHLKNKFMSILIYVRCGLTCQTQTQPMSAHYNVIDEDQMLYICYLCYFETHFKALGIGVIIEPCAGSQWCQIQMVIIKQMLH